MTTPSLRTVMLTSDTTHHTYYAAKLNERFPLQGIFVEAADHSAPFETAHPFEDERAIYERDVLLAGIDASIAKVADTWFVDSMNEERSVAALKDLRPDVVLVFGTGKLLPRVIDVPTVACLNLHGGNPEQYRGLDTHLWAIYHQDFKNLVTTLHHVDAELDTGDIVLQSQLPLPDRCELHELRAINTKVCLDLSVMTLHALESMGTLPSRKLVERGRYYSHMPTVLKEVCVQRFKHHVARGI
jgi:methionyl-tRNA formyltransferase